MACCRYADEGWQGEASQLTEGPCPTARSCMARPCKWYCQSFKWRAEEASCCSCGCLLALFAVRGFRRSGGNGGLGRVSREPCPPAGQCHLRWAPVPTVPQCTETASCSFHALSGRHGEQLTEVWQWSPAGRSAYPPHFRGAVHTLLLTNGTCRFPGTAGQRHGAPWGGGL